MFLIITEISMDASIEDKHHRTVIDKLFFSFLSLDLALTELNIYTDINRKEYKLVSWDLRLVDITKITDECTKETLTHLGTKEIYIGMSNDAFNWYQD